VDAINLYNHGGVCGSDSVGFFGVIIEMEKSCKNCEYFSFIGLDCGYCEKPSGQEGEECGEPEIGSSRQETDSCSGFKQKQAM
jgi:hypothetical protein